MLVFIIILILKKRVMLKNDKILFGFTMIGTDFRHKSYALVNV